MGSLEKERGIAQQGRERKSDCRDEGKQSAQELANEFSCGNLSPPQPSQDAAIRKNNTRNLSKETKCEHTQKNQRAAYPEIIWVQLTWPRSELSCSHADAPLLLCPPTPGRSADLHLTCLAPPLKSSALTLASIAGWRTGPDAGTRSPDSGLGGRCQHKETKPNNNYSPQRPPPLKVLGAYKNCCCSKEAAGPSCGGPGV